MVHFGRVEHGRESWEVTPPNVPLYLSFLLGRKRLLGVNTIVAKSSFPFKQIVLRCPYLMAADNNNTALATVFFLPKLGSQSIKQNTRRIRTINYCLGGWDVLLDLKAMNDPVTW